MEKRIISMLLIVSMLCGLCACGKTASANEMKLVKTEGAARVTDEKRVEQRIQENMNLYSGYGVRTEEHSFAWMNLDFVKLLKLNESSNAVLEKDGRKLKVVLQSGDMFFCVLEELEKDESLTLETGNMSMAIRGTCGIVRVLSDRESQLVLLEGKVTVTDTAGMVRQDVETGQLLNLYVEDDGTANLTLREIRSDDILDFAREYIGEDTRIQEKIQSGGVSVDYTEEASDNETSPMESEDVQPNIQLPEEPGAEIYVEVIQRAMDLVAGKEISSDDFPKYYNERVVLASGNADNLTDWQYAIYDVNHDGLPELLMGYVGKDGEEERIYIQGCWTTNGTEALFVLSPEYEMIITSNGYIAEHIPPSLRADDYGCWYYYSISTEVIPMPRAQSRNQYYEIEATVTYYEAAVGRLWTFAGDPVLYSLTDEEFHAFISEHYPHVPTESLEWYPLV